MQNTRVEIQGCGQRTVLLADNAQLIRRTALPTCNGTFLHRLQRHDDGLRRSFFIKRIATTPFLKTRHGRLDIVRIGPLSQPRDRRKRLGTPADAIPKLGKRLVLAFRSAYTSATDSHCYRLYALRHADKA